MHPGSVAPWCLFIHMKYPTIHEVERAGMVQLANWYRFLPSPGENAPRNVEWPLVMAEEVRIMNLIVTRFNANGGFTKELSKEIGWDKQF